MSDRDPAAPSPDSLAVKARAALALVVGGVAVAANIAAPPDAPPGHELTFAGRAEMPTTYGLETPIEGAGAWTIEPAPGTRAGRALVNGHGEVGSRPALAVLRDVRAGDVELHTRCRGACGVAFRMRDLSTFYVARLDPEADAVLLAVVVDEVERELGRAALADGGPWRELAVAASGDRFHVDVDGARLISVLDGTLPGPGGKALWASALGTAAFDVFAVRPGPARPLDES